VDDLELGNRVKSIDASIHQLGSSSCKIILDLSVSIDSTGFLSEKFLSPRSVRRLSIRGGSWSVSAYLLGKIHHTLRQPYLT
jgi:hypothetical protein